MGILHHITRKPWLAEQGKIDNQTEGGAVALPTAKVGLRVILAPLSALFMLFMTAYLMRMSFSDWTALHEPSLLWANTAILVLSSLVLQRARMKARQGDLDSAKASFWIGGVFAFGFLGGQLMAWQQLTAMGYFADTNPANAFFYLLTALHGIHLTGGLVAWGRTLLKIRRGLEIEQISLSIELCSVYWHYLLLVWAVMFSLLLAT